MRAYGRGRSCNGGVLLVGLLAARNLVRIVARRAGHLAGTKTRRHAQPVGGMRDLERIVVSRVRRVIEIGEVIAQRFARPVGERSAIVAREFAGHPAGRFKVTLQAGLQLALAIQPGGIDDQPANRLRRGFAGTRGVNVGAPRSVTALAIDAFRDLIAKRGTVKFDVFVCASACADCG